MPKFTHARLAKVEATAPNECNPIEDMILAVAAIESATTEDELRAAQAWYELVMANADPAVIAALDALNAGDAG